MSHVASQRIVAHTKPTPWGAESVVGQLPAVVVAP